MDRLIAAGCAAFMSRNSALEIRSRPQALDDPGFSSSRGGTQVSAALHADRRL
jgi:hypothetical protein